MNLRQKVKQAKKELATVDERYGGPYALDMVQNFQEKSRLQKIINYKRKPSRFVSWNEERKIDTNKLTYISLRADYQELLTIKSPNGKPLTKRQIDEFVKRCGKRMYGHGLKVYEREPSKKEYTDYEYFISDCRTKQKVFHIKKLYRQYYGDDKLYSYNIDKGE